MHPRPFFGGFLASAVVLRKGSPTSAGASAGIRACVGRYVNQHGWFSLSSVNVCNFIEATRRLSWYGVGLASADRLLVVGQIPASLLGSLKCDPPKGNGRRPQKTSAIL